MPVLIAVLIGTLRAATVHPGEQFVCPLDLPLVATTVTDAQRRLGTAAVTVAGHHEETVCYVDLPSHTLVAFMAQAEGLNGSFTARRLRGKAPGSCSRLPGWASAKLEKGVGGLRLGMLKQHFAAVVGKDLRFVDGFETATFERTELLERKAGQAEPHTLFISIVVRARFEQGRLVEYVVLKSAST